MGPHYGYSGPAAFDDSVGSLESYGGALPLLPLYAYGGPPLFSSLYGRSGSMAVGQPLSVAQPMAAQGLSFRPDSAAESASVVPHSSSAVAAHLVFGAFAGCSQDCDAGI